KDKEGDVRVSVAEALGSFGPAAKPAVPAMIEAYTKSRDPNWGNRSRFILALGALGPAAKAAVPMLIEALKDREVESRPAVAKALGKIGPDAKAAIPALTEALKDEYRFVGVNAAVALVKIDPTQTKIAIPPLLELLK